ncbi:hypothetical protein CYMTET_9237, partial [Cymbomonas tetramitiformis]
ALLPQPPGAARASALLPESTKSGSGLSASRWKYRGAAWPQLLLLKSYPGAARASARLLLKASKWPSLSASCRSAEVRPGPQRLPKKATQVRLRASAPSYRKRPGLSASPAASYPAPLLLKATQEMSMKAKLNADVTCAAVTGQGCGCSRMCVNPNSEFRGMLQRRISVEDTQVRKTLSPAEAKKAQKDQALELAASQAATAGVAQMEARPVPTKEVAARTRSRPGGEEGSERLLPKMKDMGQKIMKNQNFSTGFSFQRPGGSHRVPVVLQQQQQHIAGQGQGDPASATNGDNYQEVFSESPLLEGDNTEDEKDDKKKGSRHSHRGHGHGRHNT